MVAAHLDAHTLRIVIVLEEQVVFQALIAMTTTHAQLTTVIVGFANTAP